MPLKHYGVLKGHPIARRLGSGTSPHYQVHALVDDDADYRIAFNVLSKKSPAELLYFIDENFSHRLVKDLKELPAGFTRLESALGGLALDYQRAGLVRRGQMTLLRNGDPGGKNALSEKLEKIIQHALAEEDAMIYAFGDRRGPEPNIRDPFFGFTPGNGVHDIHMNQGNVEEFKNENGAWQDGGLFIHFPSEDRWGAVFLAFQSQSWEAGRG